MINMSHVTMEGSESRELNSTKYNPPRYADTSIFVNLQILVDKERY